MCTRCTSNFCAVPTISGSPPSSLRQNLCHCTQEAVFCVRRGGSRQGSVGTMQFLDSGVHGDLTYSDVFLVPRHSDVQSRYEVNFTAADGTGMTTPLIASNMNAVTGPRIAATVARRGGLGVLSQDMPPQALLE